MEEKKVLFYYFGDDEAYFRTLIGEFKTHTRQAIQFERIFESDEKKIQSLFLQVLKNRPACVFIDFSKYPQDYLHLARVISRTPLGHKFVTIGLVDYLSPPEILIESIATGVNLTHIKSAESYDVIFDVMKLTAPSEIDTHGFATASLNETWDAGIPVKIGYVHSGGLHIETDHNIQKGDRIRLNHHWTKSKIVPSKDFFVKEVSTKNLFYHFKHAVDVEFLFVDEFIPPEGMEASAIETKKKERDEYISYHRKQLTRWIDDNMSRSLEKKAKVLVIDRELRIYENQVRTDKHPYTIRSVPFLDDVGEKIDYVMPQVIAFVMEKEDAENPKNTTEELMRIVEAVKVKIKDKKPFLVVFNSVATSQELQATLDYPHLMATENELSADVVLKMAELYEKKVLTQPKLESSQDKSHQKVFLKKTNLASIAELLVPVTVVKLSETDMIFKCDVPLEVGTNIHLTQPVEMFVQIRPSPGQSKTPEYYGLIHSLGEDQKKQIRKYINSVFFREHDAKVTAEAEGFKKLNETKLQEKQDAIKKAREEAEEKARIEAEEKAQAEKEAQEKSLKVEDADSSSEESEA